MNLSAILQAALGDAFVIERELSGGGMSRVFLAREPRLDRNVVIKVLPPQLAAGVPADRFEREIQLAAALQHPHIVPVLAAGSAGELLYYVMPHVAGESVAERLELDGPLPVTDAARILRDVADALAYAHSRGVVHRDIKPANVLLSGNHGMVTDFGVAKALGALATGAGLTGSGFALGTPAYMAPEQAAADPAADHRADIYAFGALAYELLTGEPPFAGRSAQAVLAAQLSQTPDSVTSRRADLPPAFAELVMRCLTKDPARRPQSAAEIVTTLEALPLPSVGVAVKKRYSMGQITFIAVAVLIGVTAVIAVFRGDHEAPTLDPNLVAILPFRVAGADSGLHYLREGMMDLLAAKLTGEGGPRAADPQTVMSAWRRGGGSDSDDLPQDAALRLAGNLGAGEVLVGGVVGSARQLTITASIVTAPGGAVRAASEVIGPADSVPALVDRLAGQLLVRSASLDDALSTRSAAALRSYLAGRAAYRRGDYTTAAEQLQRALVQDSTLTQAALQLICAQAWGAPVANFERVQRLAWDGRDRLNARERAQLEAFLGPRFPEPPLQAEILTLSERAVELARDNPDTWYQFADHLYHHGAYLGYEDWAERARAGFERALALDSASADPLGHLVELAGRRGDTVDMRRLATLFLATGGARSGGYSVSVRWHIAHVLGDTALAAEAIQALDTVAVLPRTMMFTALHYGAHDDVARMLDALARRASTRSEQVEVSTHRMVILMNQGRLRDALALVEASSRLGSSNADLIRVGMALRAGVGDSARTAASVQQLSRLVAGPVPAAIPTLLEYYTAIALLGEWAGRNGDAAGASRAAVRLRAVPAAVVPLARYAAIWAALLDGQVAALRGLPAARSYADHADSLLRLGANLWPPAVENVVLAQLYDALGDPDRALAVVRRGSPRGENFLQVWLLREEARFAARSGDRAAAHEAYERCIRMLWNPDPEVLATLEALKREIGALDRD